MKTYITFYKDCKIIMGKNFCVEGLSSYLSTLTKIDKSDFQMARCNKELKIKVDWNEVQAQAIENNNYNYVKITTQKYNSLSKIYEEVRDYYYFITHTEFLAVNTVEFTLSMDTVNTFCSHAADNLTGLDSVKLDKKTRVLREHKDRLIYTGKEDAFTLTDRYVDLYSEGLIPPLYKLDMNEDPTNPLYEVELNNPDKLDWYLVYRKNPDENTSVDCFCFASEALVSSNGVNRRTLYPTDFAEGLYYFLNGYMNNNRIFDDEGDDAEYYHYYEITLNLTGGGTRTYPLRYFRNPAYTLVFKIENGKFRMGHYSNLVYYSDELVDSISFNDTRVEDYLLDPIISVLFAYYPSLPTWNELQGILDDLLDDNSRGALIEFGVGTTITTSSINDISRNDAKLIKIIKLPYRPDYIGVEKIGGVNYINYPHRWVLSNDNYAAGRIGLKLADQNILLKSDVYDGTIPGAFRPYRELVNPYLLTSNVNLSFSRDDYYESKLLHSDYYQPKFIYDSFSYVFNLEKLDITKSKTTAEVNTWCDIDFCPTTTINSRFLFKFPNVYNKYEVEDYPFIISVSRNNEMPIYNDEYINYIRAGYNYDVKAKQRTEAKSWITAGMAVAGGAALGAVKGSAAGWIGAAVGAVAGLVSAIFTTINAEESLQQKQTQLLNQSATVYSSDDVDLYSQFTNNRAKYAVYRCSPKVRKQLADLFYYTGYISNEIKKPIQRTRMWFNFIQCDPVFSYLPNVSEDIKEDIISKFNEGITYFHRNFINDAYAWDLDQVKENWEVALYNAVNV